MNPKALIPLVAGLGIAGFAAKLGFDHLSQARGETKTVTLWTVGQDVPRGALMLDQHLRPLPYPAELAPPGALTDKAKIVGRVPHTGVPANVPVLDSMLLPEGTPPGVHVPNGFRAVAVKIDESSGVDNHLVPGCFVDVVGLFTIKRNNKNQTIAKTIIEKIEVAAVGAQLAPEPPSQAEANDGKRPSRPAKPARAVTLLVRPEQVPILHLAEQRGEIKLSMRGAGDSPNGPKPEGMITEAELLGLVEPQPEDEQADNEPESGEFADQVTSWFERMMNPQAEPVEEVEEPEVALAEPEKPQYTWVMTIYNGDERRTLGWLPSHPRQPVLLSNEGPNVFEDQDPPQMPPTVDRPERKGKRGRKGREGTPDGYQPPTIPVPHQQPPKTPVPPAQPPKPTEQTADPNQPKPDGAGGELFE